VGRENGGGKEEGAVVMTLLGCVSDEKDEWHSHAHYMTYCMRCVCMCVCICDVCVLCVFA
jgi:hypothetical protein